MRITTLALLTLAACDGGGEKTCSEGFILGADGNCYAAEGDTDTDADTDTDTDADTDADTDTDTDPPPEVATLTGTYTVTGATPTASSICVINVFAGSSYDEGQQMPRAGEMPIGNVNVTCPTADGVAVPWTGADTPLNGERTLGLFAFVDINGDAEDNPEGDIGGAPYAANVFGVSPGTTLEDLDVLVPVGAPPE